MSDYISKSELKERLVYCRGLGRTSLEAVLKAMDNTPTLSETEIIRKPFERVIEQLNGLMPIQFNGFGKTLITVEDVIKILKEECGISE